MHAMQSALPLPIQLSEGLTLDEADARRRGEMLADAYANADPFPHIVMDNFLSAELLARTLDEFPVEPTKAEGMFNAGYVGTLKRHVEPRGCSDFAQNLFAFLNSAPVLQFLEGLSGIEGLLPDPYFAGGGFHEILPGGLLGIHADFRIQEKLNIQRRLNLLIYLNPEWDPAWGGELELWDRNMKGKVQSILPLLNRAVVFNTGADSYHGHPDPLRCPDGVTRRSIALYYYTASDRVREDVPNDNTLYRARPGDAGDALKRSRRSGRSNFLHDWTPPALRRILKRRKG